MVKTLPYWIEIDHQAIKHNIRFFRELLPLATKLFCVIKSNAYGHGILAVAKTLDESREVDGVVVNSIEEGILLRNHKFKKRILVAGAYRSPELIQEAQTKEIEVEVANDDHLQILEYLAKELPPLVVHIKVNTGLNRLGFNADQLTTSFKKLIKHPAIKVQGLFSHLANSEDPQSIQTISQLMRFRQCTSKYPGYENHISASAATLLMPDAHFDLVRVGVSTFGLWPSPEVETLWHKNNPLVKGSPFKPALSFRASIIHIADLDSGEPVGYGGTYVTKKPTRTAIIPCGYYEGLPRVWSNKACVLVKGKRAPIIGRIAMNMTTIDITDIADANLGTTVTIIGQDGNEYISADEQARHADTINYELVTRLPDFIVRAHS
jgi:alanine racemase